MTRPTRFATDSGGAVSFDVRTGEGHGLVPDSEPAAVTQVLDQAAAAAWAMASADTLEGSWLGATIDRQVGSLTGLRRANQPLGPVAVFGASNFPFAYGLLGNDTASARAAGCPVVAKAHPAHPALCQRLDEIAVESLRDTLQVRITDQAAGGDESASPRGWSAGAALLSVEAADLLPGSRLAAEALSHRVGRVAVNSWPIGVATSWAQHHGGPWPATSNPSSTSVGAAALVRFSRPVAYPDVQEQALPAALQDANPWNLPRRLDGVLTMPAARERT